MGVEGGIRIVYYKVRISQERGLVRVGEKGNSHKVIEQNENITEHLVMG